MILHEPLAKIGVTMEELRGLSHGQLEQRIKKHVCSKSMREQLWEVLHADGNYPTTPRKEETPSTPRNAQPSPVVLMDPVAQLKHFAANNAIASFGMRTKQPEQPQEPVKSAATTQAVKTMLNLPQPRSSASSPPSTKKPPSHDESQDNKEVRALLWVTGTQRASARVVKDAVSYYGLILDCGYLPKGRDVSKDAMYFKFSTYNKELQQTKYITVGTGRSSESLTVVDLTLYNHGHMDNGTLPPIPEVLMAEVRASSDRHPAHQRSQRGGGGNVGTPHHNNPPQTNASFGRRSIGDDSNERGGSFARRGGEGYDSDEEEDYGEHSDARGRRSNKRDSASATAGRRGRRGRGGHDDDSWDHYASNTVCKYYRTGGCRWGDACKFAHPE
jgi:hypothetical protein